MQNNEKAPLLGAVGVFGPMPQSQKPVGIICDYDRCGDILFHQDWNHQERISINKNTQGALTSEECSNLSRIYGLVKNAFEVELTSITDGLKVHFYNGSQRQTKSHDDKTRDQNKNGSCFNDFERYCSDNGWIFEKQCVLSAEALREVKHSKIVLVDQKLKNFSDQYKREEGLFDVYFFDDDPKAINIRGNKISLFDEIENAINHGTLCIPSNIRLHLIKFDWYDRLKQLHSTRQLECLSTFEIYGSYDANDNIAYCCSCAIS
ncbi:MAG: hypothetical protein COB66_03185 [Coxiella sp. (in: Bacteria)]|nr:MAG: hypothetical protein COB66_03185 [Coxiella sp. (in: g-proteobacteria)]